MRETPSRRSPCLPAPGGLPHRGFLGAAELGLGRDVTSVLPGLSREEGEGREEHLVSSAHGSCAGPACLRPSGPREARDSCPCGGPRRDRGPGSAQSGPSGAQPGVRRRPRSGTKAGRAPAAAPPGGGS
ncbi:ribosomal large subunit pseudouridine synthase B-like [Petaurus breviceps papuanus]|uniref:ribosomal large subunit pseudouridine synthase B-like n=1 Tax=Petaurus breviceps papuanus TaxID=3040969 RepID=UPI0036D7DEA9